MYPAIILIGILIVLFVKFNSSEVYSILTSEVTSEGDDEHETETTGCLSKLNTLRATLEAKKRELKTLRTARKKECNEQLAKTQAEVDRIQTKIDNFSSKTKLYLFQEEKLDRLILHEDLIQDQLNYHNYIIMVIISFNNC